METIFDLPKTDILEMRANKLNKLHYYKQVFKWKFYLKR